MADIDALYNAVHRIAEGFEDACMDCFAANRVRVGNLVREQLYSGVDGNLSSLHPTYDEDPWFQETTTIWHNRPDEYIKFKKRITPPVKSPILNLPPRPDHVPNLFITGPFHESIKVQVNGDTLKTVTEGFNDGPEIVRKYGDDILLPSVTAREYMIREMLSPWMNDFVKQCGYR